MTNPDGTTHEVCTETGGGGHPGGGGGTVPEYPKVYTVKACDEGPPAGVQFDSTAYCPQGPVPRRRADPLRAVRAGRGR